MKGDIETRLLYLENKVASNEKSAYKDREDIIHETMDRLRRANNVIISGLPEDSDKTDNELASEIINYCKTRPVNKYAVKNAYRLGKSVQRDKPRLLKVTLADNTQAINVLKNKTLLANSPYRNVRIFSDQTPNQADYLKELLSELNDRIEAGEEDLTIKYQRGIPTIIDKDSKN